MPSYQPEARSHESTLRTALDHARRLSEPRPQAAMSLASFVQAHHVGDLSVLALAMRD